MIIPDTYHVLMQGYDDNQNLKTRGLPTSLLSRSSNGNTSWNRLSAVWQSVKGKIIIHAYLHPQITSSLSHSLPFHIYQELLKTKTEMLIMKPVETSFWLKASENSILPIQIGHGGTIPLSYIESTRHHSDEAYNYLIGCSLGYRALSLICKAHPMTFQEVIGGEVRHLLSSREVTYCAGLDNHHYNCSCNGKVKH